MTSSTQWSIHSATVAFPPGVMPMSGRRALSLALRSASLLVRPVALTRRLDPSPGSGVVSTKALYFPLASLVIPPEPFSRLSAVVVMSPFHGSVGVPVSFGPRYAFPTGTSANRVPISAENSRIWPHLVRWQFGWRKPGTVGIKPFPNDSKDFAIHPLYPSSDNVRYVRLVILDKDSVACIN